MDMQQLRESRLRSIIKAASWRILATTTTILIAYLIIGEVNRAVQIGGIEALIKLLIYYLHERAWQLLPRGTIRKLIRHQSL